MKNCGFPRFAVVALIVMSLVSGSVWAAPRILFDAGHAQTAGNADWVIDGGFSDFANVFKSQGCEVSSVKKITRDSLQGVSVLVLPEPNSVYSKEEEDVMVEFVNNGGGLYAIADHNNSDRNGDGIDSVGVLNRFLPKLGVQIEIKYFSEAPVSGTYKKTAITQGVNKVGTWGGTSVKALGAAGETHITVSQKNGGGGYIVTNVAGKGGKVVAMGDSSPYDDGTGDSHDTLHNGFSNPGYNHDVLAKNTVRWILQQENSNPQGMVLRLSRDLATAHEQLKVQPSQELMLFSETSEKNLLAVVQENPDLMNQFMSGSQENEAFTGVKKTFSLMQSFQRLHAK